MSKKGVPINYKHHWRYKGHWHERKVAPGRWQFTYTATKTRAGSPRGGLRPGQKVIWNIRGTQIAQKVSGRTYKTTLTGVKTLRKAPKS